LLVSKRRKRGAVLARAGVSVRKKEGKAVAVLLEKGENVRPSVTPWGREKKTHLIVTENSKKKKEQDTWTSSRREKGSPNSYPYPRHSPRKKENAVSKSKGGKAVRYVLSVKGEKKKKKRLEGQPGK